MTPHTIIATNVNDALPQALWFLKTAGVESPSRNGPVVVAPGPVITMYTHPEERVLFSPYRDANPFFHFFESLWMLAGRNDISYLTRFNPRMKDFSDDGISLNGAYGYRWRVRWFDQLKTVIEDLRANPNSRREVISMWTSGDLTDSASKDLPCNTHIYVDIREDTLNITVCNRSNDLWWGAYGANVVHMSMLQEFLARAIGVEVGTYYQFSNNFHLYTEMYDGRALLDKPYLVDDSPVDYPDTYPILSTPYDQWLSEVELFVMRGSMRYKDPFFNDVASPMLNVWNMYKDPDACTIEDAMEYCSQIQAEDWRIACNQWLQRRLEKRNANT